MLLNITVENVVKFAKC